MEKKWKKFLREIFGKFPTKTFIITQIEFLTEKSQQNFQKKKFETIFLFEINF